MKPLSKRLVLLVVSLTAFISPFMLSAVTIALPRIQREYAASAVSLSWVATSYLFALSICLLPAGRLSDIKGRLRVFFAGLVIFTVASLLCACAWSLASLLAFRLVQGLGASLFFTTGMALLTAFFEPGERGRAFGINVASVYLGLAAGPFVGGLMTQHIGWRSVFVAAALLAGIMSVVLARGLKQDIIATPGETLDYRGALIYAAAIGALLLGVSWLPHLGALALTAGGLVLFWLFYRYELSLSQPLFEMRLFRQNRAFALSNLSALINYAATYCVAFLLSLYLQYVKGLDPAQAGSVLLVQPLIQALLSPVAGRISDSRDPGRVASVGMLITACGLAGLTLLDRGTGLPWIVLCLAVLGVGFALFSSPNTNAIMSSVEPRHYGGASASLAVMRSLGQVFSMAMTTTLFALFIGRQAIGAATQPGFLLSQQTAFVTATTLCLLAVVISLRRGPIGN